MPATPSIPPSSVRWPRARLSTLARALPAIAQGGHVVLGLLQRRSRQVHAVRPAGVARSGNAIPGPESPWTDLLCARITEFLRQYPVEWINFDAFTYGKYRASNFKIRPAWYVKKPFREIIGREMPDDAAKISADESLAYMREVLARQFHRIQEAMHQGNPGTKANFNPPYFAPTSPSGSTIPWSTKAINWWPNQPTTSCPGCCGSASRISAMTTIVGREGGLSKPDTWRRWYQAGCDFFGYAWSTPPDFRPHPKFVKELEITCAAYHEMA